MSLEMTLSWPLDESITTDTEVTFSLFKIRKSRMVAFEYCRGVHTLVFQEELVGREIKI